MKLPKNENRLWGHDQVKSMVKRTQDKVGGTLGWNYLSYEMQCALLSHQAMHILLSNDRTVDAESIRCLYMDLMRVAGLIDEENSND